jgi:hypothetical protein
MNKPKQAALKAAKIKHLRGCRHKKTDNVSTPGFVTLPELAAISKAEKWGLSYKNLLSLYHKVVLPIMMFGSLAKVNLAEFRKMLADPNSALYQK